MSGKKQPGGLSKREKRLRRNHRERQSFQRSLARMSSKLTEQLNDVHDLFRRGKYDEAEELLRQLDRHGMSHPEVVQALVLLYQLTGDHERCCEALQRLTQLCPDDTDARMYYAQESMLCGRPSIALVNYREFIERWPDHPHVSKAKSPDFVPARNNLATTVQRRCCGFRSRRWTMSSSV